MKNYIFTIRTDGKDEYYAKGFAIGAICKILKGRESIVLWDKAKITNANNVEVEVIIPTRIAKKLQKRTKYVWYITIEDTGF